MRKPVPFGTLKNPRKPADQEALNKINKVAQYANGRKREVGKTLAIRRADFDKGQTSREAKVGIRWDSHGYHRPGSMQ